jgi:polyhydroxyalkanoate synthesis repressor PhaR
MSPTTKPLLQIRKYPNRRYYDTTRSCHVTLQDIFNLVREGHDVFITDSRNEEDITNLVLLQVLLERDPPKLDLFPSAFLHTMIRTNRQHMRSFFERVYGPIMQMMSASQKQWDHYLRQAMGGTMMSPLEWANRLMKPWTEATFAPERNGDKRSGPPPAGPAEQEPTRDEMEELRAQLAEISRRIESLAAERQPRRRAAKNER